MVRVRITKSGQAKRSKPAPKPESEPVVRETAPAAEAAPRGKRGLSERQWFLSLLVLAGLLLLFTFRGCILPSGVGPKKPVSQPSPATTASVQPGAATEYTVQAGDTLSAVAQKHGVTVEALAEANGIDLNKRVVLSVGQKLKIPPRQ